MIQSTSSTIIDKSTNKLHGLYLKLIKLKIIGNIFRFIVFLSKYGVLQFFLFLMTSIFTFLPNIPINTIWRIRIIIVCVVINTLTLFISYNDNKKTKDAEFKIDELKDKIYKADLTIKENKILKASIDKHNESYNYLAQNINKEVDNIAKSMADVTNNFRKLSIASIEIQDPVNHNNSYANNDNIMKKLEINNLEFKKSITQNIGVLITAQYLCNMIYNFINNQYDTVNHQVTVYRVFSWDPKTNPSPCSKLKNRKLRECRSKHNCLKNKDGDGKYCKMIACKNKYHERSNSWNEKHCFNYRDLRQKQHVYISIAKNSPNDIVAIDSNQQIKEHYVFHNETEERENNLSQYIGIPIKSTDSNDHNVVVAILQIDTLDNSLFGLNSDEIIAYAQKVFLPFGTLLKLAFAIEDTIFRIHETEQL